MEPKRKKFLVKVSKWLSLKFLAQNWSLFLHFGFSLGLGKASSYSKLVAPDVWKLKEPERILEVTKATISKQNGAQILQNSCIFPS